MWYVILRDGNEIVHECDSFNEAKYMVSHKAKPYDYKISEYGPSRTNVNDEAYFEGNQDLWQFPEPNDD